MQIKFAVHAPFQKEVMISFSWVSHGCAWAMQILWIMKKNDKIPTKGDKPRHKESHKLVQQNQAEACDRQCFSIIQKVTGRLCETALEDSYEKCSLVEHAQIIFSGPRHYLDLLAQDQRQTYTYFFPVQPRVSTFPSLFWQQDLSRLTG